MIKIAKKNYFRCRRKAALNLNGSAAMVVLLRTEQFVYFLDSLIPLYCICIIFFQQIQLLDKTFCRTLTKTTLDHLARNNMVKRVGLCNCVKYV